MKDKNTNSHFSQEIFSQTHFACNSLTQNPDVKFIGFPNNFWILNTGASNHMCSDMRLLRDIQIIKPLIQVFLPNEETL